jgi:hypothetical protein
LQNKTVFVQCFMHFVSETRHWSKAVFERHMQVQEGLIASNFCFPPQNGLPRSPAQNGLPRNPPRNRNKKNTPPKKQKKGETQNGTNQQRANRQSKALETFVDQKFAFELGKTFEPEVFRDVKNFCRECANAFLTPEDFAEHCQTEHHKFRVIYQKAK